MLPALHEFASIRRDGPTGVERIAATTSGVRYFSQAVAPLAIHWLPWEAAAATGLLVAPPPEPGAACEHAASTPRAQPKTSLFLARLFMMLSWWMGMAGW